MILKIDVDIQGYNNEDRLIGAHFKLARIDVGSLQRSQRIDLFRLFGEPWLIF